MSKIMAQFCHILTATELTMQQGKTTTALFLTIANQSTGV